MTSRCIPDQPEGVHDETSETVAIPKIRKLAKEFEKQGVDGVIISCCGDPGLCEGLVMYMELLRKNS